LKQVEKYAKYQPYLDFIERYKNADNAADGSERDANANVENKNITTMEGELFKGDFIGVNRLAMWQEIKELYDEELAEEYLRQLEEHEIYRHDETALKPYCVSITMYPFLFGGITSIGGLSDAPTNIHSYTGGVVNLVFAIASQFAGAVSTPEFLPYFDYFLRKEYGDDYYLRADEVVDLSLKKRTIRKVVEDLFQQAVYSLNQPAAARNFQCVREDTTQLWTPQGFKYLSELKEGDTCFVWKDGKISEQPIKHLNVYDYEGEMIQFKGRNYQQTVTPNHRVVYKSTRAPEDRADKGEWVIKEAKDIEHHLSKVSMPIAGQVERKDANISDNLLRLCTYALTDGSIITHEGKSPYLVYYMSPNRKGLEKLKTILQEEGIAYTETQSTVAKFGSVNNIKLNVEDSSIILSLLNNTKKQMPDWFLQLSPRQAQIVLKCWSETDGQQLRQKDKDEQKRFLLQCDSEEIADVLQQVCMIAGLGSAIVRKESDIFSDKGKAETIYVQTFARPCKRVDSSSRIFYKGRVWCPTTDAGIVIFREENKTPYVSGNSVFWNIAYYDEPYFKGLFQDFVFPDGSPMIWESTSWLQETFMNWFNEERKKKILTFPVESISLLHNGKEFMDPYWKEKTAEMWAKGHSFFCYTSDSVDSLSSCCRLRNEMQKNTFSFTLGAGGVSTGSKCVMTMNINRLVQNAIRDNIPIEEAVAAQTEKLHKYLLAFNEILKENLVKHMLPIYEAGFISLDKQYLTIGINGFVEGAEFLSIEIAPDNPEYISYGEKILKPIYLLNKRDKDPQNGIMFNTEFVPAENLGVKFAKWDKRDGYFVPRDCYNSYFYLVEDETKNVLDKFKMSGKQFTQYLDGGSAYHCNLSEHLSKDQYLKMLDAAMVTGCPYFTFNIPNTICNDCGHIDKHCLNECPACGSKNLDYATRVIGYLKRVSCFSKARREEAKKRAYIHG
jgi:ribonucleoside-triphosphate reductase